MLNFSKMFTKFKKKQTLDIIKNNDLERIKNLKPNDCGIVKIKEKDFEFHHAGSFYDTFKEIFIDRIYEFSSISKEPVIIDCGANMGLSILFFSEKFPNSKIIAFEPDKDIFDILEKNLKSQQINNVIVHQKALWDSKTTLEFYTDYGMGGSITNKYQYQIPKHVETLVLADYLNEKIDFLKIDIEGAEYRVLKNCGSLLKNVENIFIEYHSYINEEQHLEDILQILKENGFRYHLKQSFSRSRPFDDDLLSCENMDMAINIFAYKEKIEFTENYFEKNKIAANNLPLVSICIPVFNGEKYIRKALDSAINQTYGNIEILIIDDNSNDNTINIIEEFALHHSNIKIYKNVTNQGMVRNWKNCVENAAGDWIKFLFQDDYLEPRCIEKLITTCINNNLYFALCARDFIFENNINEAIKESFIASLIKPENIFIRNEVFNPQQSAKIISKYLFDNSLGEPICTLFHKKIYYAVDGFNENLKQLVDYEFASKIILNHPFIFLKEKLVRFRFHLNSETSQNTINDSKNNGEKLIKATIGDYLELLESYQNNYLFSPVKEKLGQETLKTLQQYIYLRACRLYGKNKIARLLNETIRKSNTLKDCSFNFINYKIIKYKFKTSVKPFLRRVPV